MSADLYAAFMTEEKNAPSPTEVAQPKRTPIKFTFIGDALIEASTPAQSIRQGNIQPAEVSPLWRRDINGSDVLFDADSRDGELDDDFGAFETVSEPDGAGTTPEILRTGDRNTVPSVPQLQGVQPLVSELLAMEDEGKKLQESSSFPAAIWPKKEALRSDPIQGGDQVKKDESLWEDWGDFVQTQTLEMPQSPLSKAYGHPHEQSNSESTDMWFGDNWEAFEDGEPERKETLAASLVVPASREDIPKSKLPTKSAMVALERPTNIPPPSSLLLLLSSVFEQLHINNASNQQSKTDLGSRVVLVFRTASRIVAGKTLRWKRDTILAQSLKIGQAGKGGGMKLAAINKGESLKEEREAGEMISCWSRYVHEFNNIIAQAQLRPHRMKLSASPSLKILAHSNIPDTSKQCAICGLKRTERVNEVDTDADDLFGEFWTEHWGHRDCYEFWYSYKDLLGQR